MLARGHEQRRRCSGVPGTGNIGRQRRVVTGRQQQPPPPPSEQTNGTSAGRRPTPARLPSAD